MAVTLINAFEVPAGRDDEFVAGWQRTADYMREEPGFLSTRLHVSLDENAQFRYVNLAEWQDPKAFQAAVGQDGFRQVARETSFAHAHPSLYRMAEAMP